MKIFYPTIILCLATSINLISCKSDNNDDFETENPANNNNQNDNSGNTSDGDNDSNSDLNPAATFKNPNILLIIADDMGLDATPGFDIGSEKPSTPTLTSLLNSGIKYTNVWSSPTCTPTRAGILTGKYGFRTGVQAVRDVISTSEVSLQSRIKDFEDYNTAIIGKWHLSNDPNQPTAMGIDHYAGSLSGALPNYENWTFTTNGVTTEDTTYATTKYTNLAIDWVNEQQKPWFLWLAHNAPHTPFHLPSSNLHQQGDLPNDQASIDANPRPYYFAMIEAMDTEIGRLLNAMDTAVRENTLIIFIGDNGTPGQTVQEYNSRRAKGSVFQGGINVPMIVSGKNVTKPGTTDTNLINTTDLFATILELTTNQKLDTEDSKSFAATINSDVNIRNYVYAEGGNDSNDIDVTIRNKTHKYIKQSDGTELFYNLSENPLENPNLIRANQLPLTSENSAELEDLKQELARIQN